MFGGQEILEEASTEELGPKILPALNLCLIIHMVLFLVKIIYSRKHMDDYIQTLRISAVENVTNVYTATGIAVSVIIWMIYLQYFLPDEFEEDDEISRMTIVTFYTCLILAIIPYMTKAPLR